MKINYLHSYSIHMQKKFLVYQNHILKEGLDMIQ